MKKGFQFPRINGHEVGYAFSMPVYRGAHSHSASLHAHDALSESCFIC